MKGRVEELKQSGNAAFSRNDWSEALKLYQEAFDIAPSGEMAHLCLSNQTMCLIRTCEFKQALAAASRLCDLKPSWFKAHLRKAQALLGLAALNNHKEMAGQALKELGTARSLAKGAQKDQLNLLSRKWAPCRHKPRYGEYVVDVEGYKVRNPFICPKTMIRLFLDLSECPSYTVMGGSGPAVDVRLQGLDGTFPMYHCPRTLSLRLCPPDDWSLNVLNGMSMGRATWHAVPAMLGTPQRVGDPVSEGDLRFVQQLCVVCVDQSSLDILTTDFHAPKGK
jgi:hypothetical protein